MALSSRVQGTYIERTMARSSVFRPLRIVLDDPELHPVVAAYYPPDDNLNPTEQLTWAIDAWLTDHPDNTREEARAIVASILQDEEREHRFLCVYAAQIMDFSKSILDNFAVIRAEVGGPQQDNSKIWQ